jgi:asparagine synthase (glutamine-hydrolysing)
MCGIAAVISPDYGILRYVEKMTAKMRHRGPDGLDHKYYDAVGLGHVRLAIIDLTSAGAQPMERSGSVIIFNGELYNYRELKKQLVKRGCSFTSNSDTEVILHLYREYDIGMFEMMNGMWSMLLYDTVNRRVLLSRDRMGKKPLYYAYIQSGIVVASEIKPIFELPTVSKSIDMNQVDSFLLNGQDESIVDTTYAGIKRFPAASYCAFGVDEIPNISDTTISFWQLPSEIMRGPQISLDQAVDEFKSLMRSSVEYRLQSERQVGTALSGGIDSAIVAYYVNKCKNESQKQKTYSCVYADDKDINEERGIASTTAYLGLESHKIYPNDKSVVSTMREIAYHMELPYDGSLLAPWYTYQLAKSDGTVVTLDGQGSDELFAGYRSYVLTHIMTDRQRAFQNALGIKQKKDFVFMLMVARAVLLSIIRKEGNSMSLNQRLKKDLLIYLKKHLMYGDRLSMAHGVESRLPFLDVNLVEWAMQLPDALKIGDGWTKYILRRAMHGALPDSILWNKHKLGFPSPEIRYFNDIMRSEYQRLYERSRLKKDTPLIRDYHKARISRSNVSNAVRAYNALQLEELYAW